MSRPKTTQDDVNTINRSERPTRNPVNGKRDILDVKGQEAGFHYCWVNDENVGRYEDADYEFVTHEVVIGHRKINAASSIGGKISKAVGNGITAYLMRVPDEYYKEDMDKYHQEIDDKEATMYANLNKQEDGRYGKVQVTVGSKIL